MRRRILQPAVVAGVALSLVAASAAFADTLPGDADVLTAGVQGSLDLGAVAPGQALDVGVAFELRCSSIEHVDPGQSVVVSLAGGTMPPGGAATMEPVTLGPIPPGWPADGSWCDGHEPIPAGGTVRIVAPTTAGPHLFSLSFGRALVPAGQGDDRALGRSITAVDIVLAVVESPNTPPVLVLPGDMAVVADLPDGWTASYVVGATDAEDEPDPTPTCAPAPGALLPLGTTTITCSVSDSGGLTAEGTFTVTVAPKPADAEPPAAVVAAFESPVLAGVLSARAGRTIPLKVRLAAGDEPIEAGSVVAVVAPCAGGDPVVEVAMSRRAASERWFGLLRTKGLEAGCYAIRARHAGGDVGGFRLILFDRRGEVAKERAAGTTTAAGTGGANPRRARATGARLA